MPANKFSVGTANFYYESFKFLVKLDLIYLDRIDVIFNPLFEGS